MSDMDKVVNLFKEIGVDFEINDKIITINEMSLSSKFHPEDNIYGESVSLMFEDDGTFKCFEGYGD